MRARTLPDRVLNELREQATNAQARAGEFVATVSPRLKAAQERAAELVPEEKDATKQSESVRLERAKVLAEVSARQGLVQQARLLEVRAQQLLERIADRRRAAFADIVFSRTESIVSPDLWLKTINSVPGMWRSAGELVSAWIFQVRTEPIRASIAIAVTLLVVIVFYLSPWRKWQLQWASRPAELEMPPPLVKASSAAVIVLAGVLFPAILLVVLYQAFALLELLPVVLRVLAKSIIGGIILCAFIMSLSIAVLAPGLRSWRIVNVSDSIASAVTRIGSIIGVLVAVRMVVDAAIQTFDPFSDAVNLSHGLFSVATGLLIIGALRAATPVVSDAQAETEPHSPWRILVPVGWMVALAALLAPVAGYIALGYFISNEVVIIASVLMTYFLLVRLADALSATLANPEQRTGRLILQITGLSGSAVRLLSVGISALLKAVIFVGASFAILATWGINFVDTLTSISVAFNGTLGKLGISVSDIVGAIIVLIVGLLFTRVFQGWLSERFLPETHLDAGVQSSIRTGTGYLGAIACILIALSYLGLGLQNIAIVAGALSVGIGFGLQSIVNNFVSGLILLIERPIKIGDRIEVGTRLGVVKRINVRATEIVTYDNVSVIVPNGDLITGQVVNWMHDSFTARLSVKVGASYDSDPDKVISILLDIASANKKVLKDPAPFAVLDNFGVDALEFTVFFYVGNISADAGAANEVRLEILRRFRDAKIEIPFPQRDVHFSDLEDIKKVIRNPDGGAD